MRFIIVTITLLIACCQNFTQTRGRAEEAIQNGLREKCGDSRTCSISLESINWLDWDEMVVFLPGVVDTDINRTLGVKDKVSKKFPFSSTMVFRKEGVVVYAEENIRSIEGYQDGDLEFSDIDEISRFRAYPRSSTFSVEHSRLSHGGYFSLVCANCK